MATDIMMQLGDFQFAIDTAAYQELERTTSWRWPAQARVGQSDALQHTGKDNDTITLSGVIYPSFRGAGSGQIDKMRAMGDQGRPLRLVDGRGYIHGLWVINSIRERQPRHEQSGVPRRQDFTVKLTKYDDDTLV